MLALKTFLASLLAAFLALFVPKTPAVTLPAPQTNIQPTCNSDLWQHIWNPWRLKVMENCKTVTGTIEQKFLAEDGDYHLLLAPDHLVVEIICAGPISPEAKTAQKACASYQNTISIPDIGDKVEVTGSYVFDTSHNWSEIHPVSAILKI